MDSAELAIASVEFIRRYNEYTGKQINNSTLRAGSPMYYYCEGCHILVATLPENWYLSRPERYCAACQVLVPLGVIDRLVSEAIAIHLGLK